METDKADIEDKAARLPHRERARLALKLIESLEPGRDEDVDELWLEETERRLARYDAGGSGSQDADEALSEIEAQLK
ncbi:MAG: addiction module protein [Gammaproteobacteria bacterium]|nr:addiction module protein [Gammaproteobacteria bacterium]